MTNGWLTTVGGLPRTGETLLTDAEVIICDALYRAPASAELVESCDFATIFNLPYDHGLNRDQVIEVLKAMQDRGVVVEGVNRRRRTWALTVTGGVLWERERRPIWTAYCQATERTSHGITLLRVNGVRREVVAAYLDAGRESKMLRQRDDRVEWTEVSDGFIVSWKPSTVVTASLRVDGQASRVDWETYEARRIWWRNVPELLRSHGVLAHSFREALPPRLFATDWE